MDIRFIKLRVGGDDMVLVDFAREERLPEDRAMFASMALDRRRGVGGNSLVSIESYGPPAIVRSYLPDGRMVRPLGDALLVAARYLFDCGRSDGRRILVDDGLEGRALRALDAVSFALVMGMPEERGALQASHGAREIRVKRLSLGYEGLVLLRDPSWPVSLRELEAAIAPLSDAGKPARTTFRPLIASQASKEGIGVELRTTWRGGPQISLCEAAAMAAWSLYRDGLADPETAVMIGDKPFLVEIEEGRLTIVGGAEYVFEGSLPYPDPVTGPASSGHSSK